MAAAADLPAACPLAFTAFPLVFAALLGIASVISHVSERPHCGCKTFFRRQRASTCSSCRDTFAPMPHSTSLLPTWVGRTRTSHPAAASRVAGLPVAQQGMLPPAMPLGTMPPPLPVGMLPLLLALYPRCLIHSCGCINSTSCFSMSTAAASQR